MAGEVRPGTSGADTLRPGPNADHEAFGAPGVHGQTIWIDPSADMVIVRFASNPVAGNAANDPTSLPAYRAVADYLKSQERGVGP